MIKGKCRGNLKKHWLLWYIAKAAVKETIAQKFIPDAKSCPSAPKKKTANTDSMLVTKVGGSIGLP